MVDLNSVVARLSEHGARKMTREDLEDIPSFQCLSAKDQKFWVKFGSLYPDAADGLITFFNRINNAQLAQGQLGKKKIPLPTPAAIKAVNKFVGRRGTYSPLFKGLSLDKYDPETHRKGAVTTLTFSNVSFWTQKKAYAEDWCVDGGGVSALLSLDAWERSCLLDMNLVPWVFGYNLGNEWREPELLLVPGSYQCKIVKVFE